VSTFTEADYAAAIPPCCSLRPAKEHMDMMLCWSLAYRLEAQQPITPDMCTGCELRINQEQRT